MKYMLRICSAISIVGCVFVQPSLAQNAVDYFKLQTMFQESDNKCFEGNRFAPDAVLQGGAFMADCEDVSGQYWKAVPEGNGYFRLKTLFQGEDKCLEGNRHAPDAVLGGSAFMDTCQNVTGQLWKAVPDANGYFRLKTQFQGEDKCLEGNRFSPQAVLQGAAFMDNCQNVSGQLWSIMGGNLVNGIPMSNQPASPSVQAPNVQIQMPTAVSIQNQLTVAPTIVLQPQDRVTLMDFVNRRDLRYAAPSIDIQSINFDTGSAVIRYDQYDKVNQIGQALTAILGSNPGARFLIEGHTDAVGADNANYVLSQNRAEALRSALISNFGIPTSAIVTAGFGERDLLVPTQFAEWQNRRVTLRRIDQFVR